METIRRDQNGIGDNPAARQATKNLTLEQKVVKAHEGLDPVPGYVLVIFEKRGKAGAVFSRVLRAGERPPSVFRIPFLDWTQKYLAVAVIDSALSYEFSHKVMRDDGRDVFKLNFHLTYRVGDSQRVAEIWEHDPLRQLCGEIARVIGRSCAKRKMEMVRDRFRDLEKVVVEEEKGRLSAHAATLGLKIVAIELEKPLRLGDENVIEARKQAENEKDRFLINHDVSSLKSDTTRSTMHRHSEEDLFHRYRLSDIELGSQIQQDAKVDEVDRNNQRRRLRAGQTDAIITALNQVGSGINTPEALREGYDVAREISSGMQSDNGGGALPTGLPNGVERLSLGSGEDNLSSLLAQGIREVDRWSIPPVKKQALRSTLLHIVAEALLDDQADEKTLKQYTNKLSELGRGFDPPLGRTQRLFLDKFLNVDELKNKLR